MQTVLLFSLLVFLCWFLLCCFARFEVFSPLPLSCVCMVFPRGVMCILLCCNFFFFCPCYMQNSCVLVCMFAGLPLRFSCARFGSLFPLLSFCFFCLFLLGLNGPYSCPLCPPVNIATIGISCFVVSFLCVLCVRHGRILGRNDYLCPPKPHSRDPLCPKAPTLMFVPTNTHLWH